MEPARVAAEAPSVAIDPGDRSTRLIGERHQIAGCILHPAEIGRHVTRAGGAEHLSRRRTILGATAAPRAAVDEDEDRAAIASGTVDVELFDLGRPISNALGRPNPGARRRAVAGPAPDQLLTIRRIGG